MGKSSRRVHSGRGRGDVVTVFSPRTSGPWHVFEPLHRTPGVYVLAVLVAAGAGYFLVHSDRVAAAAVVALGVVVLACSFAATWTAVGMLVRARAELAAATAVAAGLAGLSLLVPLAWAVVALCGALVVLLVVPVTSRALTGRVWCVLDRHRVRACLRQAKVRTMNMDGALPFLLWARPTHTGERLWLWVRAGSSAGDIQDALEYIAPACYAREARLSASRRVSTLVVLDVVRRDPLGRGGAIANPLSALASLVAGKTVGEGSEPITPASITDITTRTAHGGGSGASAEPSREPVEVPAPRRSTGKNTNKQPATTAGPVAPAVVVNGEDLSDYVD